jgi:hypothetical protein
MKYSKQQGSADFSKIPNGAPGIETRLPLIHDGGVAKARHVAQSVRRADRYHAGCSACFRKRERSPSDRTPTSCCSTLARPGTSARLSITAGSTTAFSRAGRLPGGSRRCSRAGNLSSTASDGSVARAGAISSDAAVLARLDDQRVIRWAGHCACSQARLQTVSATGAPRRANAARSIMSRESPLTMKMMRELRSSSGHSGR